MRFFVTIVVVVSACLSTHVYAEESTPVQNADVSARKVKPSKSESPVVSPGLP